MVCRRIQRLNALPVQTYATHIRVIKVEIREL